MIPKIDIYDASGDGLQHNVSFGARPLGGTSNPVTVQIWNDKPEKVEDELLGVGDGATSVFQLDHFPLIQHSPYIVKVSGVPKTEGVDYSLDRIAGTVTFLSGHIPASGDIEATYYYGSGAGEAENVFVLARCRFTSTTFDGSVQLPTMPSMVYEVAVNDVATLDYTVNDDIVTLDSPPSGGAIMGVIYEDESCALQMLQVKSDGVEDPFTVGIVDDEQTGYLGVGGHKIVAEHILDTGDDVKVVFKLNDACIIENTLVVKVDGDEENVLLDPVVGEIEFNTAPGTGKEIKVSYKCYKARQIGSIPPGCARHVQLRGHAPTTATQTRGEAFVEVWAV